MFLRVILSLTAQSVIGINYTPEQNKVLLSTNNAVGSKCQEITFCVTLPWQSCHLMIKK